MTRGLVSVAVDMPKLPRRYGSTALLVMWGLMGSAVGWCLLWVMMGVAQEFLDSALEPSRWLASQIGISWDDRKEILMLHLQVAGMGFIAGSGFRFAGLRKQFPEHNDHAV